MSKTFKSSLKQWVGKTFKSENKAKRFMKDVASKIATCNLKESKNQLEDIIAEDLLNKIQEIRVQEGSPQSAYKVLQNFLNQNQLGTTQEIKNHMTQQLMSYFDNYAEEQKNHDDSLENIFCSISKTYDCICPKATKDLQMPQRIQSCYRCKRECHTNCLWGAQENAQQYECPMCFGRYCLPNRRVQEILFGGYLRQTKKDKIEYKINLPLKFQLRQDQALQVRCMRLGKQNKYELTWPQNCALYFNNRKIAQFKPLPISSSLKRRVDQEIAFEKRMLVTDNVFIIQEKHQYIEGSRSANSQNHFIIAAIVQVLPSTIVEQQMMARRLGIQQSKQQLRQYLNRGSQDNCFVQKIQISLSCQFYGVKVTMPVRSVHCRSHYQPFDLKNFILANNNSKNTAQKWKCPICKKRAYDIQVDDYLLSIIRSNSQLQEIEFNRHAQLQVSSKNSSQQGKKREETRQPSQNQQDIQQTSLVKRQSRIPTLNKYVPIALDQIQLKPRQKYQECIQLQDTPQKNENKQIVSSNRSFKRSYKSRSKLNNLKQSSLETLRKKNKCDDFKEATIVQELISPKQSSSVQQLEPIQSKSPNSDFQSQYCEDEEEVMLNRKKQRKFGISNRRRFERSTKDSQLMMKTISPSPSIRTVIPEAIRINEVRLPQPKKVSFQHFPPIELISDDDEEEQTTEATRQRRVQFHLTELQKQKILISRDDDQVISQQEKLIFKGICEKFMSSLLTKW